jgi:hypothetical protein
MANGDRATIAGSDVRVTRTQQDPRQRHALSFFSTDYVRSVAASPGIM